MLTNMKFNQSYKAVTARKLAMVSSTLACLVTLSACASLGTLKDDMTARFHVESEPVATQVERASPPAPRWIALADERMPTTDWVGQIDSTRLSPLVLEALSANTNVLSAAARWDASIASAIAARSSLFPTVSLSAGASRTEYASSNLEGSNSLSVGPSVSWEADVWGRIRDGAKAGDIEAFASAADFASARLSIAGQTSQAWLDLIEAKLLLDLAQKSLETQQRALRLTARRFESGLVGSADVRLSRSSVASAKASLASREQLRSSSARRLEILLRRYPSDSIDASLDLPALPALKGSGVPSDILARRPDLIAAEQRLYAQGLRVDVARKNLLPRLSLSADGKLSGGDIADLFDIDSLIASIAASLTAPLYQGGALKAEVARNEAVLRAQVQSYAGNILQAYLEVENALDAERRLSEREAALRESLKEAQKAEERLMARYVEGLATILQMLDAQSRALNAESALISARKERLANRVRLHLALGGGQFGQITQEYAAWTTGP